jgi:hypothetical protein
MSDRAYFSVLSLAAMAMIALALVWPQGMGARSPGPFGHPVVHPEKERQAGPSPSLLPIPPAAPDIPQAPTELPAASQ